MALMALLALWSLALLMAAWMSLVALLVVAPRVSVALMVTLVFSFELALALALALAESN